jgi:predicted SAM-dependent methyltransferase
MISAFLKNRLVRKVVGAFPSEAIDVLVKNHFSKMSAVMCRDHSQDVINALAKDYLPQMVTVVCRDHLQDVIAKINNTTNGPREAIDALARDHFPQMIAVVCHHHLQDVIAGINNTTKGHFKYVGDGRIKIILGAGPQRIPGWLSTDINVLNITQDASWRNLFNPESIDNILAEHVVEHLSLDELYRALEHARKYLKPGGIFRIAVPDAFHPSRYYYNLVKPGGWETPQQHKLFFDCEMITRIAESSGYKMQLLEYFDEKGIFHKENYSQEDGAIQRCAKNNAGLNTSDDKVMEMFYSTIPQHLRQQFHDQNMTYTSLIVDLSK